MTRANSFLDLQKVGKSFPGLLNILCWVVGQFLLLFIAFAAHASDQVVLQLAWKHQFQFAGYYAALHNGFYRDAGLDVLVREGGQGRFAREEVLSGRAQYGVAGSELVLHRMDGDPFVVLAPIFQHSPSILLVREDSEISHPQDLVGKRVMLLPGKKDADILAAFLNEGVALDAFQRLDQTYDLNDLLEGRTDAVSAYMTNEPWQIGQKGVLPKIISPLTYGVDFYSDCLFTTEDEISTHPRRVQKFLAASLKGWEYAMEHPEEIIDLLLSHYNLEKDRGHLRFEAEAIRKIMLPELVEIGHMNPGRWRHIARTYLKLNMIDPDFSLEGFLYDPTPKIDYRWIALAIGIPLFFGLMAGGAAYVLLRFNKKLRIEINEREHAEKEIRTYVHFLETLNQVNRALQQSGDTEQMPQSVVEATLAVFDCDRAWLLHPCDPDSPSFKTPIESTRPEYPGARQSNLTIPMTPAFQSDMNNALAADGPLSFGPGNDKPLSMPFPGPYNVQSQMFMSIHSKIGKPWMFGVHQCSHPRVWTQEEKRILSEIGQRLSDGLDIMLYQRELSETKNLLHSVVEQSPIPTAVADLEGNITIINPACRENLGLGDKEVVGKPLMGMNRLWKTYTADGERLNVKDLPLAKAVKGQIVTEELLRVVREDGAERWFVASGSPVIDEKGKQIAAQIVFPDVTELKDAEESLKESEKRFRNLFEFANDGICMVDPDGRIIMANQRMCDMMGYDEKEILEKTVHDIAYPGDDNVSSDIIRQYKKDKMESVIFEKRFLTKKEEILWGQVASSVVLDEAGNIQYLLSHIRDVTDRKKAEARLKDYSNHLEEMVAARTRELEQAQEELILKERLAVMGNLSGSISHELRNPLAAIDSSVYLLKLKYGDDDNAASHLQRIAANVGKANGIVQSLLDLTRMEGPRTRTRNLRDLVPDLLRDLGAPDGIRIETDYADAEVPADVDARQIRMALKNIMENAIQAMGGDGTLSVSVLSAESGESVIVVSDTGPGIPPEEMKKIFQPLFSTKVHGIGFGLSIAKTIIEKHGGDLTAESAPGSGASFTVALPRARKEEKQT